MNRKATAERKEQLRREGRERRRALDVATLSREMMAHIAGWQVFQQAGIVLSYAALPEEIDVMPLMTQFPQKAWYLPRVVSGEAMVFHRVSAGDVLVTSRFGIAEPLDSAPVLPEGAPVDLMLLPGVMMDACGRRLGFGKGYYDRFLAQRPGVGMTACLVPRCLLVAELPGDPWDVPMRWGITEEGILALPLGEDGISTNEPSPHAGRAVFKGAGAPLRQKGLGREGGG